MKPATRNIGLVSLGCPKALVDSEHIVTRLRADGYSIVDSYAAADLVIVNTCGFINDAIDESMQAIQEGLTENGRVIVTGCLGGNPERIHSRFPAVLKVTGPHACDEVVAAVHDYLPPQGNPFIDLIPAHGLKLTPPHYAYLKISEGCNNRCSFCIIPALRGRLTSRVIDDVMREAESLVQSGVRELLVISQDTSAYGRDIGYAAAVWRGQELESRFLDLCRALGQLGVWVRLHYVYPYPHVDEVFPLMAGGHVLPYLDIPFQHASRRILKRMRRPAHAEDTLKRIEAWRRAVPDLVIRSTFIVGFPGETEADFQELVDWLRAAAIERVGCFEYSPVAGAAANELDNPVPAEVAGERRRILMETAAGISRARLHGLIGTPLEVIVDEVSDEAALARTRGDAPGIDGNVRVAGPHRLRAGDLARVRITHADDYDLEGVPI